MIRFLAIAYLLLSLVTALAMVCALLANNRYWVIIFGCKALFWLCLALYYDAKRPEYQEDTNGDV